MRPFLTMYWVYILQSQTSGRYYCGFTSNLQNRLRQHNDPNYPFSKTTKRFPGPWIIVWQNQFSTRSEAMIMEKRIKKQGVKRFLERVQSAESRPRRD